MIFVPHIEFTAIERKIKDTETELKNIALCSDENMRSIMTSELQRRLFELQKKKGNGGCLFKGSCFTKNIR